jgi:excisionase family DNA binding protein
MTDPLLSTFPIFLSPKSAAKIINVTPQTLYGWIRYGNGPPIYKMGTRAIKIRKDELLVWIEKQRK